MGNSTEDPAVAGSQARTSHPPFANVKDVQANVTGCTPAAIMVAGTKPKVQGRYSGDPTSLQVMPAVRASMSCAQVGPEGP